MPSEERTIERRGAKGRASQGVPLWPVREVVVVTNERVRAGDRTEGGVILKLDPVRPPSAADRGSGPGPGPVPARQLRRVRACVPRAPVRRWRLRARERTGREAPHSSISRFQPNTSVPAPPVRYAGVRSAVTPPRSPVRTRTSSVRLEPPSTHGDHAQDTRTLI